MTSIYIKSAIAASLLLALPTAAMAATGEFDNMCTQGLVLGKDVSTDCSISTVIDGKTYCFGNEAGKTEFMKDPKANLAKAQEYYDSNGLEDLHRVESERGVQVVGFRSLGNRKFDVTTHRSPANF